ncbi:MAG TPA: XdhC/CoxI family protein [Bacteroidota bacterium]|nr:XdhC/CoxI family protein [Bacteroidota bacterium]
MDILEEIIDALQSDEETILATIISTNGSTPASALSKMLVKDGGKKWLGTVGGGCLEGDVLQEAITMFGSGASKILSFELNETNLDQGLICGGSLDVLIEPLLKKHLVFFREMKQARDNGDDCIQVTFIAQDGKISFKHCLNMSQDWNDGMMEWWKNVDGRSGLTMEIVVEGIKKTYRRNETERLKNANGELILEPVQGMPSLIIFGGGHVSKYISRSAAMVGFHVTIIDDRPEYANPVRFPEAKKTIACDFAEAFGQIEIKPSTYVVIVTRGHRSDEEILSHVVEKPAKYIGMIGSQRKVLTTYKHLVERGISIETLRKVHAPIGIEIGATTAEEIAVSVVAQLIAVRRGEVDRLENKSNVMRKLIT